MGTLKRLLAIFVVVAKRVVSQPWLVIATILGLVISIALMMSIPLYADAVYHRIFLQNIAREDTPEDDIPPFTFTFRYDGSIHGSVEWEDIQNVDAYLRQSGGNAIGLPQQFVVRYFTTDPFGIFASDETDFNTTTAPLLWASFSFLSELQDHITITDGTFPQPVSAESGRAFEVLVHEDQSTEFGFQVGELYIAFLRVRSETGFIKDLQFPIRISGFWKATDPADPYWFFKSTSFSERLILPEETFGTGIAPQMDNEIYTAIWYLVLDGTEIHHNDADILIGRTLSVQQQASNLLTNTSLSKSPLEALVDYKRSSNLLTILLYAFSIPIFGLLLAFILLTSSLVVERRRNEIAVLRSRGAMAQQMLGIAALESVLLGLLALAVSSPTAMGIAELIGQARSFLDFGADNGPLRLTLTANTLRFGIIAVFIAMLAQVLPTFGASEHTIVSYKREQARMLRKPWWQRAWLDVMLMAVAAYGAYLLQQQGSLVRVLDTFGNSPYQNPLLFLVPSLGIFALTLFFLRLMPLVMSGIAWFASQTRAVGLLMASRHLARTPGFYSTPLILLVLTLSLSAFTASLASTLDEHLVDNQYYRSGADIRFMEAGEGNQAGGFAALLGGGSSEGSTDEEETGPRWYFKPVSDYQSTPDVELATRVARYEAVANLSGGRTTGVFFGIERTTFPAVTYWREDFAEDSLGALMNAMAVERNGVLVTDDFLRQNVLLIGDDINIGITAYGQRTQLKLKVIGTVKYFPTWYPSQGPLFVGDLDYFFETAGGQFPYDVWLLTKENADNVQLVEDELNLGTMDWSIPSEAIAAEQALPERQGLFGLLSVGFAAAAVLTVLGFLLYALFSFRRRFIEFGVLRAVGLSSSQMIAFLGWELAFLILMGGGLGTALGGWVSAFFIPFLQIGVDEASRIPPYSVDIAWSAIFRIYVLFGGLFVVALVALVA
ncbi:MAG: ABC transporter permease, partial [Anaerolineae bacterium]|nr:ABC transporter permease [Anaerolineae bacterium]